MIQFRLDNRYVSELDKLLKEKREQHPERTAAAAAPQKDSLAIRELSPADIPFSLKKR